MLTVLVSGVFVPVRAWWLAKLIRTGTCAPLILMLGVPVAAGVMAGRTEPDLRGNGGPESRGAPANTQPAPIRGTDWAACLL